MKVTYTNLLSRKILLSFLVLIIILAIAALFVRDSIAQKLAATAGLSHQIELDQSRPQQVLLLLHQAEDLFQASLLDSDSHKGEVYKYKLSRAFAQVDTLLKTSFDTVKLPAAQRLQIHSWYAQKLQLSEKLLEVKHRFDSLLVINGQYHKMERANTVSNKPDQQYNMGKLKKKGFFARIKAAIKDTNAYAEPAGGKPGRGHKTIDPATQRELANNNKAFASKFKLLQQTNLELRDLQKQLIGLNTQIINELEQLMDDLKQLNYNITDSFRSIALHSYSEATLLLNKLYLGALLLVLIFATMLIVFVIKLDRSEVLLRNENDRAVIIAQQKMDLLLHMTHEIRNPLTAIKGFLFIFSKTELSPRQSDMLTSIRSSSDMLLHTLNDTLDAAKMESSELQIHETPFKPSEVLKEVAESMEFSAAKKKLDLIYHFKGDETVVLSGDSFRLKQVMVNLLSNAIKYTKTGNITIDAVLLNTDNETKLNVEITDTGDGVSVEQQASLFSKYYQANSARGNVGTGLGLYICKQLIELQKGNISARSELGVGSTFSFTIPYKVDEAGEVSSV
ncbi:sensor histidine kinase [Mucilaginibacter sp. FT3.2]|uniref:sensor histidine kinase n=1 Tax=Mucilaginibacter sp. FT3.2 TaxID=2723090 RepID=UPI00160FE57A|nr:HAMP domain-containing sensor histidine kinase [Mucilaginibacter sp. FT3.2]MBB6233897.1 signal transduction histidine kinase [Mucilaginibacter sp. FT3.2]